MLDGIKRERVVDKRSCKLLSAKCVGFEFTRQAYLAKHGLQRIVRTSTLQKLPSAEAKLIELACLRFGKCLTES